MDIKIVQKILIEELIRIAELSLLDKAEDIAQQAHLYQKRRNKKPYIIHPKRVQLLAKALDYGIDIQVIAILHDVIEDADNKQYYENLIRQKFGNDIYSIIKLLSHDKNMPYDEYLVKLASSNFNIMQKAFKVKMLDMLDNLTDLPSETQKEKYKNAIQSLINAGVAQNVPNIILKILGIQSLTEAPKDIAKQKNVPKGKLDIKNADMPKDSEMPKDSKTFASKDNAVQQSKDAEPVGDSNAGGNMKNDFGASPDGDIGNISGPGKDIFGKDSPDIGRDDNGQGAENDEKNSILQFNDKLKTLKIIDKQRTDAEPGFNFEKDSKFYEKNYISVTPNGSLLIAVPTVIQNNADKDFIKSVILPKIIKVAYQDMKNGKDVVLMGDYGLPYYDGKYMNSASGMIAKVLNDKFKNTIIFDTWNPQDYYAFISNTYVWKELKERTKAKNIEIKSALYLFLLATNRDGDIANKLKTDNVLKTISKWGLSENDLEMETHDSEIQRVIFPDKYSSPETEASYIIKTYLQLLKVNMLKKVIKYEREGKAVIVLTDINTSWSLNKSFKNLQNIQQPSKSKTPSRDIESDKPKNSVSKGEVSNSPNKSAENTKKKSVGNK